MNIKYTELTLEQSLTVEQLAREFRDLPEADKEIRYRELLDQLFIQKNYYEKTTRDNKRTE